MRAISVMQPWAWAILRGGKTVENRTNRKGQAAARAQFNRPGPLLIHAGQRYAGSGAYDDVKAMSPLDPGAPGLPGADPAWTFGAILGAVDLVSVHTADECMASGALCSPWAEPDAAHLVLENPRVLAVPVEYRGSLGLWQVTDELTVALIRRGLA